MKYSPRKLPLHLECPIDNFIYKMVEPASRIFKKLNFTPNYITTISAIFGIISIYFLYNHNIPIFILFYLLSYFFDCVDGYYARKYNQVTVFGDYYDHIKDISINLIVFVILFYQMYQTKSKISCGLFIVIILLAFTHMGCQECYFKSNSSPSLGILNKLCPGCKYTSSNSLKYTRHFGFGTLMLFVSILTLYIYYHLKKKNSLK